MTNHMNGQVTCLSKRRVLHDLLVIWKTSARGTVSQFGDVNVKPLSVPASSGDAFKTTLLETVQKKEYNKRIIITSSVWLFTNAPLLQSSTLDKPMNQSGEGTIFVRTETYRNIKLCLFLCGVDSP